MYKLYTWYGWGFGKWIFRGEFKTIAEIRAQLKGRRSLTYAIIKNGKVIKEHYGKFRFGMIEPTKYHFNMLEQDKIITKGLNLSSELES